MAFINAFVSTLCTLLRRLLRLRTGAVIFALSALVIAAHGRIWAFQGYEEPFFVLDFPQKIQPIVGTHYLGAGQFSAAQTSPVPVATIGSVDNFSVLNSANSNVGLRLSIARELASSIGMQRKGFTVACLAGLKMLQPTEDIPLPRAKQRIVSGALYVDTFVLAKSSNSLIGANVDVALNSVKDVIGDLTGFVFGQHLDPVPVPSPVSSLDCNNLSNQSLSALQVATGTPAPVQSLPPPPTAAPSSGTTPAPGSTPVTAGGAPTSLAAIPLPTGSPAPGSKPIEIAVDASLTRAAVRFQNGSGLIVGVEMFDSSPMGQPQAENVAINGVSQSTSDGFLSFQTASDATSSALCVQVSFVNNDSTISNQFEYCPPRDHIWFSSHAQVPPGYRAPSQYAAPFRVMAQMDSNYRSPSLQRTQYTIDLANLQFEFDQLAAPNLVYVSGNSVIRSQQFLVTPVTRS